MPADAASGSFFAFTIERLVASPTPVGPVLVAGDSAAWTIVVTDPTVVLVDVRADETSPFYLTTDCGPTLVVAPSAHASRLCSRPGTWRVEVDPAAGVAVDIQVTFSGHVADVTGAPSSFEIAQTRAGTGCVVPGVCLP